MSENSTETTASAASASPAAQHLLLWFLAGFAIVFVGLLFLIQQHFYTGTVMIQCKLWKFYVMAIRNTFTSSGAAGPASGIAVHAIIVLLIHIAVSCVGGLSATGLGAIVRRFTVSSEAR